MWCSPYQYFVYTEYLRNRLVLNLYQTRILYLLQLRVNEVHENDEELEE